MRIHLLHPTTSQSVPTTWTAVATAIIVPAVGTATTATWTTTITVAITLVIIPAIIMEAAVAMEDQKEPFAPQDPIQPLPEDNHRRSSLKMWTRYDNLCDYEYLLYCFLFSICILFLQIAFPKIIAKKGIPTDTLSAIKNTQQNSLSKSSSVRFSSDTLLHIKASVSEPVNIFLRVENNGLIFCQFSGRFFVHDSQKQINKMNLFSRTVNKECFDWEENICFVQLFVILLFMLLSVAKEL